MQACPLCNYVMDPFDDGCRRCGGKGLPNAAPSSCQSPLASSPFSDVPTEIAVPSVPVAPAAEEIVPPLLAAAAAARAKPAPPAPVSPGSGLPYFFAANDPTFRDPVLYRVYGDAEALLFINAGPYHMAMIAAIKQFRGDVSGRGGPRAGGLARVGAAIADKGVAKRADVLDALSVDGLREEAATGNHCFSVNRTNASRVLLRPVDTGFFSSDDRENGKYLAGYLELRVEQKGEWKLKLLSLPDARSAVWEFRRVLGVENVNVRFPF